MANFFTTSESRPVVFKAGQAILSIDGDPNGNAIALQVQVQFQREVQVVPTLSTRKIMSIGVPQGQCDIASVLIDDQNKKLMELLHGTKDCTPPDITISFNTQCDGTNTAAKSSTTLTMVKCVASAMSIQAQGDRGYVANNVQIKFLDLRDGSTSHGGGLMGAIRGALGL